MKKIKCLRCPKPAFSVSVGFGKEVGYCKNCAEKILAVSMIMDKHNLEIVSGVGFVCETVEAPPKKKPGRPPKQ